MLDDLVSLENQVTFARSDRDDMRAAMREQVILFRENVNYLLPNSKYARALPDTPKSRADQDEFLQAVVDLVDCWQEIHADEPAEVGPALVLRGGYTLAQCQTDLTTLRQRYDDLKVALRNQRNRRDDRDRLLTAAMDRMIQYRVRVPQVLPPNDPLVASMPRLRPAVNGGGGVGGGGNEVPAAPGQPTLEAEVGGQILVTWSAVPNTLYYNVYRQVIATDLEYVLAGPASVPTSNLSSLPPNEIVRVRITAVNAVGESPPGPHAEIETIA